MLKSELQEAFAQHYALHRKPSEAYIAAGYKTDTMSKQVIANKAQRLLNNEKVAARIDELQQTVVEVAEKEFDLDAKYILSRLKDELEADIADLYFEGGGLKPLHMWPEIWRKGMVSGLEVDQKYVWTDGEKVPDGVVTKIKLAADRSIKRLELAGKHIEVQAFKERLEVDGGLVVATIDENTSQQEAADIYKSMIQGFNS